MPTGLTAPIHDNKDISFADFAKECAQHIGYLASYRDDEELPVKIEVSMYHNKELSKAQDALKKFKAMSEENRRKMAVEEIENKVKQLEDAIQGGAELEERYLAMKEKVEAWELPTKAHESLKNLMITQLDQSIQFDCMQEWAHEQLEQVKSTTPTQWAENHLKDLKKSVEYHQEQWEEDKRQAKNADQWLQAFYKSLPEEG